MALYIRGNRSIGPVYISHAGGTLTLDVEKDAKGKLVLRLEGPQEFQIIQPIKPAKENHEARD